MHGITQADNSKRNAHHEREKQNRTPNKPENHQNNHPYIIPKTTTTPTTHTQITRTEANISTFLFNTLGKQKRNRRGVLHKSHARECDTMLAKYLYADIRLSTPKSPILPNIQHVKIINIGKENNSCPSPPTDNYYGIHFTCPNQ
nr:MAG TPA: hypothetical protein [Bacteriophage sp.]